MLPAEVLTDTLGAAQKMVPNDEMYRPLFSVERQQSVIQVNRLMRRDGDEPRCLEAPMHCFVDVLVENRALSLLIVYSSKPMEPLTTYIPELNRR